MKNPQLEELLLSSGMMHWRIAADWNHSLEQRLLQKPVTKKYPLLQGNDLSAWQHNGLGRIFSNEKKELVLETPNRTKQWPEGSPNDGDYCSFGSLQAALTPKCSDWRIYNRLRFKLYADCPGMHSPMIGIQVYNDGTEKVPDKYCREGYHTVHLKNNQWNECVWEFPSLPRDYVTKLVFEVTSHGQELSMDHASTFYIADVTLEFTPTPDRTVGWECNDNSVVFSTAGYWLSGQKTAIASLQTDLFLVCDAATDTPVYTGTPTACTNEKGSFYIWDFTPLDQEGQYYLKADYYTSKPFAVSLHPLYESIWKSIHFLYCERCGHPVGRGHGTCHADIIAKHKETSLPYHGGWHDAGDVSQQTLQTAEVVHSLLEVADTVKEKEPFLYYRIMEEAVWGLDFVLRTRFQDGYRATSAGICRWTNGFIGDMDDCEARVHNHALENFLMAGVEAYAAKALSVLDPELSKKAYRSACEDYHFALDRFAEKGMELPVFFEHSYSSSLSQYWASASWAASCIYDVGKESFFAEQAVKFATLMLSCQEVGSAACPMAGFFYREPNLKTIVHFNHQSREQIYMQALHALCLTQPQHENLKTWEASMQLYGTYLKQIYSYSLPYGMLPAGIHKMDEYLDQDTFSLLHLMTTYEEEKDNYKEQLANAFPLTKDYCLRFFPIWFSFRGNIAIHLATGKAASLLGKYFKDFELIEIAREQIYWVVGKNPFGQSLVYGVGSNYAQQYGALNGEMVGSIPVGIETRGNDDIPFWPMENNATYKEVWTSSVGRWLWVVADLY